MLIKQEIYCHNCDKYVQFEIDIDQDGNYTIPCPNCGHEHYRVVRNRRITDQRWQSSGANIVVTWATTSTSSMDVSASSTEYYYYGSTGIATTCAC